MDEVQKFHELDREYGIEKAINLSTLWSPELANYYNKVDECVSNPLSTFLLIWAMEFSIPSTYHLMLDSFNESVKYNDFKVFLEKHIGHDECDHGPATLEWLNILLANNNYSNKDIGDAILCVSEVFNARVATYNKLESILNKP